MPTAFKLDPSFWDRIPVASAKGFNPMVHLRTAVETAFPDFTLGLFSEEDLENRRVHEGYVVLTRAHWPESEDWNNKVALRYGLKETDGGLTWKNLFLCVRPTDWGERRRKKVMLESEERFALAADAKAREVAQSVGKPGLDTGSAHSEIRTPQPPELYQDGSWDAKEASQDVYDSATKAKSSPSAPAPKRGRPKKEATGS